MPFSAWVRQGGRKMLRKILIAAILMSLIPVSMQGRIRKSYFDSVLFTPQKTCVIPVKIDIGMYVEILDIETLSIKLKQVGFETFEGCTEIRIRNNFDLELGCIVKSTGLVPGDYSCWLDDPKVPLNLSNNVEVRKVCVKAEKVKLLYVAPGIDVHAADVTVTIVPDA
jgi:hypothetical protein